MDFSGTGIVGEYILPDNGNNSLEIQLGTSNHLQIEFLICQECFWCASCFDKSKLMTIFLHSRCPICDTASSIDSIPISLNEGYKFGRDDKKGVELEFFLMNCRDEEIVRYQGKGGGERKAE